MLRVHGDGQQARIQFFNILHSKGLYMYRIQLQHKDFLVINKSPGLGMHDDAGEPVRLDDGRPARRERSLPVASHGATSCRDWPCR